MLMQVCRCERECRYVGANDPWSVCGQVAAHCTAPLARATWTLSLTPTAACPSPLHPPPCSPPPLPPCAGACLGTRSCSTHQVHKFLCTHTCISLLTYRHFSVHTNLHFSAHVHFCAHVHTFLCSRACFSMLIYMCFWAHIHAFLCLHTFLWSHTHISMLTVIYVFPCSYTCVLCCVDIVTFGGYSFVLCRCDFLSPFCVVQTS